MLADAAGGGPGLLTPASVEKITRPDRVGLFDEAWRTHTSWGLGCVSDGRAFGRHASPETWGHHGAMSSVVLADPKHSLVVAAILNGMPAESIQLGRADHKRFRTLAEQIYEDLALA